MSKIKARFTSLDVMAMVNNIKPKILGLRYYMIKKQSNTF